MIVYKPSREIVSDSNASLEIKLYEIRTKNMWTGNYNTYSKYSQNVQDVIFFIENNIEGRHVVMSVTLVSTINRTQYANINKNVIGGLHDEER